MGLAQGFAMLEVEGMAYPFGKGRRWFSTHDTKRKRLAFVLDMIKEFERFFSHSWLEKLYLRVEYMWFWVTKGATESCQSHCPIVAHHFVPARRQQA